MQEEIKKIGFDLDGVVCDLYPVWVDLLVKKYNVPAPEKINTYDFLLWFPMLDEDEIKSVLPTLYKMIEETNVVRGSNKFLHRYYKESKEPIIFITARWPIVHEETVYWIKNWIDLPFKIFHSQSSKKYKIIEKLGLDAFVDDHAVVVNSLVGRGIEVYLLNQPWNENDEITEEVIKINNLNEINIYKGEDSGAVEVCINR